MHALAGGISKVGGLFWQPACADHGANVCEEEAGELESVALKVNGLAIWVMLSILRSLLSTIELSSWLQVLPLSAHGCERNWSTYNPITNRKRNKLDPTGAEDLVYVQV